MKEVFKICALFLCLGLSSVSWSREAFCSFKTYDGHYLTAIDGGGRGVGRGGGRTTNDVLATNRKIRGQWERFKLVDLGEEPRVVAIKTYSGHYLSAQGGGGRTFDVIHSNRTQVLAWEKFRLIHQYGQNYAIQTYNGNYLTAVGGGGRTTNVIHSDATRVGTWELWYISCWLS